jgi:hypothetical protein
MRTASLFVALLAALHYVLLSTPCFAQAAPTPSQPVQPVPYQTSQPVPYGQPAPAQPSGPVYTQTPPGGAADTVVLKNGGMIRGTLIEVLPNDHATVQLPSGQSAIVQWSEIHHIERGAAPQPQQGGLVLPAGPPAQLPNATAPVTGPTVLVHIESTRKVVLDRRNPGEDQPWVTACESPCDVQLPLNNDYRIVGEGIWASSEFDLDGQPGNRVVIKVNPATRFARTAGIVVAGAGLLAVIIGIYVVAIAAEVNCINSTSNTLSSGSGKVCDTSGGGTTVGWVVVGAGVVTMAVGGILILMNLRTGESQEVQAAAARSAWYTPPNVSDGGAFKRLPTFREASAIDKMAPVPTSFPIFSRSF